MLSSSLCTETLASSPRTHSELGAGLGYDPNRWAASPDLEPPPLFSCPHLAERTLVLSGVSVCLCVYVVSRVCLCLGKWGKKTTPASFLRPVDITAWGRNVDSAKHLFLRST